MSKLHIYSWFRTSALQKRELSSM